MKSFEVTQIFPISPEVLYQSWLNSEQHSEMTGGEAQCSDEEGGEFSAWDGYISGHNVSLNPNSKIIQRWRTTEFSDDQKDSLITLNMKAVENGCELSLLHEEIPDGQPDYEQGWRDHYFNPMLEYFGAS